MSEQRVPLAGSAPSLGAQPRRSTAVDPNQQVQVTVTLRRRNDSAAAQMEQQLLSGQARSLPREQVEQELSADPRDITAVRAYLEQNGLRIVEENPAARTLKVAGTVEQMEKAFSTRLGYFEDSPGSQHLSYEGSLSIPQSLDGVITSVIGLDQRRAATHR